MGGGGSKSTTTNSMVTSTAINAISNNIMNCTGNQTMVQNFVVSGNGNSLNNIKQIQSLKLSTECAQSSENVASLQQQVSSALKSAAEVNSQAVMSALSASSSSDVNTKIENDVKQNITQNTIVKIINDTNLQQNMIISGNANVINNFTQEQTTDILNKNIQNAVNKMESVQAISSTTDATSKNTQSNPLDDMIKSTYSGMKGLTDSVGGTVKGLTDTVGGVITGLADTIGGVFSGGMYTIAAVIIVGMIVAGYFFGPAIIAMIKGGPLGAMLGGPDNDIPPPVYGVPSVSPNLGPPPGISNMSSPAGMPPMGPPMGYPPVPPMGQQMGYPPVPPMGQQMGYPPMGQPPYRGGIPNYVKV